MSTGIEVIDNVQSAVDSLSNDIASNKAEIHTLRRYAEKTGSTVDHNTRVFRSILDDMNSKLYYRTWLFSGICLIQGLALTYLTFFR